MSLLYYGTGAIVCVSVIILLHKRFKGPPSEATRMVGIYQRRRACPAAQLKGSVPSTSVVPEDIDPSLVARTALVHLQHLDLNLLLHDTLWRDLCAFTGSLRTFSGGEKIVELWTEMVKKYQPHDFTILPGIRVMRPAPQLQWIEARFQFTMTKDGCRMNCEGLMRLVSSNAVEWKIWNLVTMLKNIDGWGDVDELDPSDQQPHAPNLADLTLYDKTHTPCIIVGAGFSGLCLAGRLQALGVPYLVIDKAASIGEIWANRYMSVRIHTSKEHGQFPFKNKIWGDTTAYHLTPNDLQVGYQKFAHLYSLNIQLSTNVEHASWNRSSREWEVFVTQKGQKSTLQCQNLVLAVGGAATTPKYPPHLVGMERCKGKILHSSTYSTATEWKGLTGVVIGSANSGHDITNDMVEAGLSSVTMVQRGNTPVLPVQFYRNIYDPIYSGVSDIALSDQLSMWAPNATSRLMAMKAIGKMASARPDFYEALEKTGFRVERNMDLYACLYDRFGGHYIDVGVSQKISDGLIKVKPAPPGQGLTGFDETGLLFEDGSRVDADVVVFATGFEGNMRFAVEEIVGPEVSQRLEDFWGFDEEGEIRGAWRPNEHPGIWFTGGNVALARFYSRFLALQIKADTVGKPCTLEVDEALRAARARF